MNFKQLFLGNAVGRVAISTRSMAERIGDALFHPEEAGTRSNDHLAEILVTQLSDPETVFIDIGAHIGSIIAAVQHSDSSVNVIAIEAIPQKAEALRRKFPDCEIHCCAAGDSEGNVSFFVHHQETGYSSLTKPAAEQKAFTEITVPMHTLDSLVESAQNIDVIKIDVEGAELYVLKGGANTLKQHRPTIMFESGADDQSCGYSKADLWQYFNQLDYEIYLPNRVAHNGDGLDQQGFMESHLYPRRTTNYFAIAKERREEIRQRARDILSISVH